MKLFEMKNNVLEVDDVAWGHSAFKELYVRDKTKGKEIAHKEMLFLYHYVDIRSDYAQMINDKERAKEIKQDIGLPEKWEIDSKIKAAISLYEKHVVTAIGRLYKSSLKSASDIANYLESTDVLLAERTMNGGLVTKLTDITNSLAKVPGIMRDLKAAYKEVIAEQKELEGRMKGAKTLGYFEDGLSID